MRRTLALILLPVALVVGLTACDTDDTIYHCGLAYQQRLSPRNYQLIRADRSGNWDFCDFRGLAGDIVSLYVNIHTHEIQGG